jgi:UDP-N-acetylenolpyruvoylglucosamine reductase
MTDVDVAVTVRENEPLARHLAWRTGGPCEALVTVHDPDQLLATLKRLRDGKVTVLGCGTRTVVRDGGLAGAVLRLGTGFSRIEPIDGGYRVGAAVPVAALVARSVGDGFTGLQSLASHPGSFGASLALDPGPDGDWTGLVTAVHYVSRGAVRTGPLEEARRATVIVGADLALPTGDATASMNAAWKKTTPMSWFAPLSRGTIRTQLVKAGLPGVRVRQVAIPEAAPEILVNLGGASARDLHIVERTIVERVERERGIELVPAVRWAGTNGRS